MRNFVYAARSLRRTPTLTLAVVVTLALCIGATTAIFSVVYAVLFRPLPFADPKGILVVRETWKGQQGSMSAGNWWDTKRTDRMFQYLVPMNGASVNLRAPTRPKMSPARGSAPTSSRFSGCSPRLAACSCPRRTVLAPTGSSC